MSEQNRYKVEKQVFPLRYQPDTTTQFQYPDDEESPKAERLEALRDAVHALLLVIINAPAPKLTLVALAFATGVPLESIFTGLKSNSLTDIAAALGVSKQRFHKTVVKVCKQFGINYGK
jgi:hypothetical protein